MADYKLKIRQFYLQNRGLKKLDEDVLLKKYSGFETELWLEIVTKHAWAVNFRDEVQQLAQAGGKPYSQTQLDQLLFQYKGNEVQLLRAIYQKYHLQNASLFRSKLETLSGKRFSDRQIKAFKGKEGVVLQQTAAKYLHFPRKSDEILPPPIPSPAATPIVAPPPVVLKPQVPTPPQTTVPPPAPKPAPAVFQPTQSPPVQSDISFFERNKTGIIIGASAGVLILVLTILGIAFRKEMGSLFVSDSKRLSNERVEQLSQQKSQGSEVLAKDFFDEDELLQLAQDSSLVEKPITE
jgi:hypothetical protein